MRFLSLLLLLGPTAFADEPKLPLLPGTQPDGFVQLPNQWKLNPDGFAPGRWQLTCEHSDSSNGSIRGDPTQRDERT